MEKLLFLDMDCAGANSWTDLENYWKIQKQKGLSDEEITLAYDKEFKDGLEAIFPEKARLVSKIVEDTHAKLVWSTSWRLCSPYKENIQCAREMLNRRGMPGEALMGYTPDLGWNAFRSDEIIRYLQENFPEAGSCRCAVLDDMEEAGYNLPDNCRFFRTGERKGLTASMADEIIAYLNS